MNQKKRITDPEFSLGPVPLAAFMGICTLVISPTPSKNAFNDIGVVLNAKFPTQTEFWRFGNGSDFVLRSLDFPLAGFESAVVVSSGSRFCFFFCLLCSAWERTGSPLSSTSEISTALRFAGGGEEGGEEDITFRKLFQLLSIIF